MFSSHRQVRSSAYLMEGGEMTMSASNSQPPEGDKDKKKALAAIVTAIAARILGTLAANYLRDAIEQVWNWLTS